ncbi:hypothetical protein GGR55DRAFT_646684 [Xylaria sp. FL0064]|nr:hypothetical protein GGR55DRAFT_646684 [Xylaria sp. FL0064]
MSLTAVYSKWNIVRRLSVELVALGQSSIIEMADFSPNKKCRNFEKIQEWSVKNQVNYPPEFDWKPRNKPETGHETGKENSIHS